MDELIASTVVDIICLQFLYIYNFTCVSKYHIAIVDEEFPRCYVFGMNNIMMHHRCWGNHYKDKTVSVLSKLYNGNLIHGNTFFYDETGSVFFSWNCLIWQKCIIVLSWDKWVFCFSKPILDGIRKKIIDIMRVSSISRFFTWDPF